MDFQADVTWMEKNLPAPDLPASSTLVPPKDRKPAPSSSDGSSSQDRDVTSKANALPAQEANFVQAGKGLAPEEGRLHTQELKEKQGWAEIGELLNGASSNGRNNAGPGAAQDQRKVSTST